MLLESEERRLLGLGGSRVSSNCPEQSPSSSVGELPCVGSRESWMAEEECVCLFSLRTHRKLYKSNVRSTC